MRINTHKTKVIIFNKCGYFIKEDFKIGGDNIECVNKCKYLGIIMSSGGSFKIGTNISLSRYKKLSLPVFKQYLKKFIFFYSTGLRDNRKENQMEN